MSLQGLVFVLLKSSLGMLLAEVPACDEQLGGCAIEVSAGVGDDAVETAGTRRIAPVADDRVIRHLRGKARVAQGQQERRLPLQLVDAGGQPESERGDEEIGTVTILEPVVCRAEGIGDPDELRAKPLDGPVIDLAAPMRRGDEDDAADFRTGLEKDSLAQQFHVLRRAGELLERAVAEQAPEP